MLCTKVFGRHLDRKLVRNEANAFAKQSKLENSPVRVYGAVGGSDHHTSFVRAVDNSYYVKNGKGLQLQKTQMITLLLQYTT